MENLLQVTPKSLEELPHGAKRLLYRSVTPPLGWKTRALWPDELRSRAIDAEGRHVGAV